MPIQINKTPENAERGHCDYDSHDDQPLHDDHAGWTICWRCWERERHYVCVRCGFTGVQEQLLELSSGAPICHCCQNKATMQLARTARSEVSGARRLRLEGDIEPAGLRDREPTEAEERKSAENQLLRRATALEWAIRRQAYEALAPDAREQTLAPTIEEAKEIVDRRYDKWIHKLIRSAYEDAQAGRLKSGIARNHARIICSQARLHRLLEGENEQYIELSMTEFTDELNRLDAAEPMHGLVGRMAEILAATGAMRRPE